MPYQEVLYEPAPPVATITLNRPHVLNAISPRLEGELHEALDQADGQSDIRAIILTGSGRAFSAGYDMAGRATESSMGPLDPSGRTIGEYIEYWYKNDTTNIEKLMHIWRLTKPVIAAVNGWAMGGGFWYQLACDITIASEQAVFAQPEVRHISNTSFLLAALVGWKVANRYSLTGDHMDAQEALRIGMVNEVVPAGELLDRARDLAHRIAMVPEASVRINKAVTMMGMQAAGVGAGMILNGALSALAHTSHGPDRDRLFEAGRKEGMQGFLDARDRPFTPEPFGPRSNI